MKFDALRKCKIANLINIVVRCICLIAAKYPISIALHYWCTSTNFNYFNIVLLMLPTRSLLPAPTLVHPKSLAAIHHIQDSCTHFYSLPIFHSLYHFVSFPPLNRSLHYIFALDFIFRLAVDRVKMKCDFRQNPNSVLLLFD